MNNEFTIVPILKNFENDQVIGELKILTKELPKLADFHFALGYRMENTSSEKYTLLCVSSLSDALFRPYP